MAAAHFNRGSLIIKDENLGVNNLLKKEGGGNGKGKNVAGTNKKGGGGLGSRKALNDITNKSVVQKEVATKRNVVSKEEVNVKDEHKEEFNVKDERFLHDHKKCKEAHGKIGMSQFLEIVLPGIDMNCSEKCKKAEHVETIPESPRCYPEPMEEPEPELSVMLDSVSLGGWDSDSPPPSPLPWILEPVEFALKPDIEA